MLQKVKELQAYLFVNNKRIFIFFLLASFLLKIVYLLASSAWMNDEFFYLQGGKGILEGSVLYKDFVDIKPPLIFFLYSAIIKIFGYSNALMGAKIVNLVIQALAAYGFFKLVEKLFSREKGLYAGSLLILALSMDYNNWPLNSMTLSLFPLSFFLYYLVKDQFNFDLKNIFFAGLYLGINFTLSTNYGVFLIFLPLLLIFYKKGMKDFFIKNIVFVSAFVIPVFLFGIYFYQNQALSDWYWWNIKWASYYSAEWPFYLKIPFAVISLALSWQWIPFYILGIAGLIAFFKNRGEMEKPIFLFLLIFFILLIISRVFLGRITPRYNPYLLPLVFIFFGFIHYGSVKNWVKKSLSWFVLLAFLTNSIYALVNPYERGIKERSEINEWIAKNTPSSEKIFVWYEGYDFYYSSDQSMATGFFSCGQHLNYPPIFNKMKDEDIDFVWKKFFFQLQKDKPLYILDMTGNFSRYNESARTGKMKDYMENFKNLVMNNYEIQKEFKNITFRYFNSNWTTFDPIKIWKRKKDSF